uniref:Transmembrane protein n=1 Tax=Neospora caninum (strain Liverpool) TaxID=572307 RepID=F0JB25_NEOCL|nr:hypothetical protein, conserved [Neospora caninum Liverpool]CEL71291.1 TPA: hypothetical protein, conserved [Neospora caninum Liverpool]
MPLLYHQSSLSTLLLATSRSSSSEGFSFSVPTQLLLPDGGVALGLPPSSLLPSAGNESNAPSEEERVNRLRQGPVSVFASESPEKKVRNQRSRLLLLLATLLALELLSIFAVLQGFAVSHSQCSAYAMLHAPQQRLATSLDGFGAALYCRWDLHAVVSSEFERRDCCEHISLCLEFDSFAFYGHAGAPTHSKDEYPIFPDGSHVRLHVLGAIVPSSVRYFFYLFLLVFCLILPLAVGGAVTFHRRQMCAIAERSGTPLGTAQAFPSVLPSVVISACVVVLTGICICAGLFVLQTYFDVLVAVLSLMLRAALNRLNCMCLAPHIFLVKASNSVP